MPACCGSTSQGTAATTCGISWDEWFETFDRSGLKVVYQEHKVDGEDSNFIKLVKADD